MLGAAVVPEQGQVLGPTRLRVLAPAGCDGLVLLPYLEGDKTYRGVVQLGQRTDSDDMEGQLLEQRPVPSLAQEAIEAALQGFRTFTQTGIVLD